MTLAAPAQPRMAVTSGVGIRAEVQFPSGVDRCAAWVYLPSAASAVRPAPVIIMAHGLGGTRRVRLDAFAERFQRAGYACLVFDYRYFGDSEGEPRALVSIKDQLEDWRAALAWARRVPEFDAKRVIVWGTSFSGGHALSIAAQEPQLAAVMVQCPFTDGRASSRRVATLTRLKLAVLALMDLACRLVLRVAVRVPVVARPGEAGLMTAPGALEGYLALRQAAGITKAPDPVPARVALEIVRYRPGMRARDVRCPILFCVCDDDIVAPSDVTLTYAMTCPRGEVRKYRAGHFEIYLGEPFEQVVRDQLAFLREHVPPKQ